MKEKWLNSFSRFGMFSKGAVYFLIGGLTLFAALNLGGELTDKKGVIDFILTQPFGKILAAILILGLLSFVLWRAIQAIKNPEDEDKKHRFAYAISGLFYLFFAVSVALKLLSESSGSSGKNEYISELLSSTGGKALLGVIIIGLLVKAIAQFKKILSKEYYEAIEKSSQSKKVKTLIKNVGVMGYTARGIVVLIISYLFAKALLQNDSSEAGGTKEAFKMIQDSDYGFILLLAVSLGLTMYGVLMIVKARYKEIPSL